MKAKWSSKRGKTKYNLSIDALSIPAVVFFQKAKILVESDEKVTKNPLTEKSIGFNGKQNMRIHLPCQVTSEQQFDSHIFKF